MDEDEQRAELAGLGIGDDQIEMIVSAQARKEEKEDFEVWPENRAALEIFLDCSNKWNWLVFPSGSVVRTDLRWRDVMISMWQFGVKDRRAMLADIKMMEWAALEVFNETA